MGPTGRDAKVRSCVFKISRAAAGDEDGELAEAEHHELAMAAREVTQSVVRWRAGNGEVVYVADDW